MVFCRSFPRNVEGRSQPEWIDLYLSKEEEAAQEERARLENIEILKRCIADSKAIFKEQKLAYFQTDIICTGIALFEKLASHQVYWKEEKAKGKFDMIFKKGSNLPKKKG